MKSSVARDYRKETGEADEGFDFYRGKIGRGKSYVLSLLERERTSEGRLKRGILKF